MILNNWYDVRNKNLLGFFFNSTRGQEDKRGSSLALGGKTVYPDPALTPAFSHTQHTRSHTNTEQRNRLPLGL